MLPEKVVAFQDVRIDVGHLLPELPGSQLWVEYAETGPNSRDKALPRAFIVKEVHLGDEANFGFC